MNTDYLAKNDRPYVLLLRVSMAKVNRAVALKAKWFANDAQNTGIALAGFALLNIRHGIACFSDVKTQSIKDTPNGEAVELLSAKDGATSPIFFRTWVQSLR